MATEPQNLPNRHNTPKNRESRYLRAYKAPLHLSRNLYKSTFLCKTNPILSAVGGLQMNVNAYNTRDYENKWQRTLGENKPNSNPNKANFQKAKMNVNLTLTKDYRKKDAFTVRINKPNFLKGPK